MDFNTETYAGSLLKDFREALSIPNLSIGDVYAILRWNNIEPIRYEKRVNNKEKTPVFPKYLVKGLLKNNNGLAYSRNRILQNRAQQEEDAIRNDVMADIESRDRQERGKETEPSDYDRMMDASDELLRQQEVYFDDKHDDELYESLYGRKVYFTENQIKNIVEKEKYIENDYNEKWERLPINSDVYRLVDDKTSFRNECYSNFGIADVAEVKEEGIPHYIAIFHGGLNGNGEWDKYLEDMIHIIRSIKGSYIIKLDVDVPDDVWNLTIGFKKENLNEGASGYQPEDSDAYFDTCYTISEELFNSVLKDLEKCYKDKNDSMIYTYLGIINHLLQIQELQSPIYYSNKDLAGDEPDGNPLAMKIINTCIKCYKYLQSDKENRQGWKDFERYKEELFGQYNIFKNSMKTRNEDANVQPVRAYHLDESNSVEPKKVLVVKKFLDDNFVRAAIPTIGDDGYPKTQLIVGMKGTDGKVIRNMYAQQLFDLLQDKFQKIFSDKEKRDKFLKLVMKEWYDKKITRDGLLSKNIY